MLKTIAASIAILAATSGAMVATDMMTADAATVTRQPKVDIPIWVTRPCKTEDSVNCRWIADDRGNGRGHTFIRREVPGSAHMVCTFYAERHYAAKHDYCS